MNEETQARRLEEWLSSPPGTAPPEDLDPEVLGAVYALRPDRAPAARVSLDDILGGVTEGPFATRTTAPTEKFPESEATGGSVIGLRPAAPTRPQRRRGLPAWAYPLAGVGFAAAAALAIGLPLVAQQATERMEHVATGSPAPAAAPTQPTAIAEADGVATNAVPADSVAAGDPTADKAERPAASRGQEVAGAAPPPPPAAPAELPVTARQEAPLPEATIPELASTAGDDAGLAEGAASTGVVGGSVGGGGRAEPTRDAPSGYAARAKDDADVSMAAADEEASVEREVQTATVEMAKKASSRSSSKAESAPKAAEPVVADLAAPVAAAAPAVTATTSASSPTAMETRSRGVPLDYSPSWYTRHPDVTAIFSAANAQEKLAAWSAAAALYASLYSDARLDVAQDAAWRGAKALWAGGDAGGALSVVEASLRRGGGNTVFRAHLLVLQGDLYSAMGKPTEARRAWAEASTVNARRSAPASTESAAPP